MSQFDLSKYFAPEQPAANETSLWEPLAATGTDKQVRVAQAAEQKLRALQAKEKRREATWVGQTGLDPDTVTGGLVNQAAGITAATVDAFGDMGELVHGAGAAMNENAVPKDAQEAYRRYQNNEERPEDIKLLNQKSGDTRYFDLMANADRFRRNVQTIDEVTNWSEIVDTENREQLSQDLRKGAVQGLADLDQAGQAIDDGNYLEATKRAATGLASLVVNGGGAMLNNKQALMEYVGEIAPDLVMGAASKSLLLFRNAGYGMDAYNQGIENYKAENNGQLPPQDTQMRMAVSAFGAAFLDSVGEFSLLDSAKVATKGIKDGTVASAKRVAGKGIKNTVVESSTEGGQTYLEGEATLNPASAEDIYEGAAIGGGVGGVTGTGLGAGSELAEGQEAAKAEQAETNAREAGVSQTIADRLKTGDFDSVAEDSELPADRVSVALAEIASNEKSSDAQKQQARKALAKLETRLNKEVAAAEKDPETVTTQVQEELKKDIRAMDEMIAASREDGDTESVAEAQSMRNDLVQRLRDSRSAKRTDRLAADRKLAELRRIRDTVVTTREGLTQTGVSQETSPVRTATDTTKTREERVEATRSAVNLMMQSPGSVRAEDVDALLSDAADVLDENQSNYLRVLSEAAVARNEAATVESTREDIFGPQARSGFKSLPEYRSAVSAALEAGDTKAAQEELDAMRKWARSHRTKADLAEQAVQQARPGRQMALWADPTADGGWRLRPGRGKADDAALRKNGGLQFSNAPKSVSLAQDIAKEARAIEATAAELAAALGATQETNTPAQETQATPEQDVQADRVAEEETLPETEETADVEQPAPEADEQPATPDPEEAAGTGEATPEAADGEAERGTAAEPESDQSTADDESTDDGDSAGTVYGLTFTPVSGALDTETFRTTNLLEAYFSPRRTGENQTRLPLTTRENFTSEVLSPVVTEQGGSLAPLADYVSGLGEAGSELAEKQRQLLRLFAAKDTEWRQTIQEQLFKPKTNEKFRYEDFVQFLAQGGELPENVTTAISAAAFSWVQENGNEAALNDEKAIRAILDKNDNEPVTTAEKSLLADAGTYEDNVISDLGRRASQALGLKLNKDAPQNHQAQLEDSLGLYAMGLLIQQGYIERHALQSPLLKGDGSAPHWFARIARDYSQPPYTLVGDAQSIVDAGKGTQGVLQKLFSVEPRVKGPSFEPLKRTQQTTKGTDETIPSEQKAIIENEMANKAWTLRQDMKGLVDTLMSELGEQGRTVLYRMAGAVDLESYTPQKSNEASLRGKNLGLEREVDHLLDFYQEPAFKDANDYTKPFWFPLSVWVNQRVGVDTNTVNPLSSKVHRFMMQLPEWTHTIETNPTTEDGQHKLRQFKLAALEGLGYGVDKLSNDTALQAFDKEVGKAQPHIDTLSKLLTGQAVEPEAVTAMAEFVANKEQFHTLDALVHLSRWQQADGAFESTLVREGDGITNGPALATILSGAWGTLQDGLALVNKMGFFEKGNPHQSAGAWQEDPNNNDLYETLADEVDTRAQQAYKQAPATGKAKYFAIFSLMGAFRDADNSVSKKGRKRVKTPLTGMAFGASPKKSIQNMGHDLVDIFFEDLEKALNDPDVRKGNARIKGLVNAMNTLLPPKQRLVVKNRKQAQLLEMTPAQRSRVVAEFEQTVGEHVNTALKNQFGQFIEFRNRMNKMAAHAYEMFMLARNQERKAFLAEQDLPTDRSGEPLQTLTQAQEAELTKRLRAINPVMHTAMSKASQELRSGLHIAGTEQVSQYPNAAYFSQASFKKAFPVSNADTSTKKRLNIYGKAKGYSHPGVRMFITGVHSLDSAIASRTYKDHPALNVHDAEIVAAYMMQEVAAQMNGETFKALRDYSLPTEIMKMVSRVYDNFVGRLDDLEPSAIKKAFPKGLVQVQSDMATAFTAANRAEANKLALLAEIQTVNQYGVEGGEYRLTLDDYDSIAKKQKTTVVDRVTKSLTAGGRSSTVAENLSDWLDNNVAEPERTQPLPEGQTVWGRLGQPQAASDPSLVNMLTQNPRLPVRDLLKAVPRTPLTAALLKLVNPDLRVKYITKDTPESELPETDVSRARGFWTRDNGREFVGIKSPDYVDSGVNAEMITHETLHAVLYDVVEQAKQRKGSARSRKFVREIEQIRGEMIKHLEANGLMDQYGQAVRNTHELIAWGMTHAPFQREMAKVQFESRNRNEGNALKRFIDSIKRVLFKDNVPANTGLEGLIVNTAALLEEASKARTDADGVTLKQEFGPSPETVGGWTTTQVYDVLARPDTVDGTTDSRLRTLLETVVEKVHGPYGAWKAPEGLLSPAEVYTEAKATGQMPFASEALTVFPMSDAQAFVLEQVEASLREAMASDSLAYKELVRTFKEARTRLKGTMDPDHYNYLFDLKQVPGSARTDHLSRFAALALVEPSIHAALNDTTPLAQARPSDKLGDQLRNWFDRSMQELGNHLNRTYNAQPDNARAQALAERLADIEAKRKADLARDGISVMDQAEAAGRKLGQAVRNQVVKVADSDAIQNSGNGYVQGIGALTSTLAEDRVQELLDAMEDFRARQFKARQGILGALITEARGATKNTEVFHKLLRMAGQNERERKHINERVKQDVKERFVSLDKDDSDAITRVVLRTDMAGLLEDYETEQLEKLLESPQALQAEIAKWEKEVAKLNHHEKHYMAYSKLLGYFLATGEAKGPHLSLNAHNIAALYGTNEPGLSDAKVAEAEKVIDPLVTLHALKYTDLSQRRRVAQILRRENPRDKESGMLYVLKLHEKLKADALETLFDGDKALFMKGYTREIYNPHREVKVAGPKEGKELEAQGWIKQPKALRQDPNDPTATTEKHLYMLPHGGLNNRVTGSVSLTGTRRKGSAIHGGEFMITEQEVHRQNQQTNQVLANQNYRMVRGIAAEGRAVDPKSANDQFLVPVYNQAGRIVNYRYLMSEKAKDDLLQRNNRVEDVLGSMASHLYDKAETPKQNRLVVDALKEQYNAEFRSRPSSFIKVGPESDDRQARETYQLLPPATKKAIREVWGGNDMWVRADVYDMVFGYRKYSLSDALAKDAVQRNTIEVAQVAVLEVILRGVKGLSRQKWNENEGQLRVRQFEDVWQAVVKEVKDAWVIKNVTTLLGNIASNVSILLWSGMNPKKIIETHKTAFNGLLQYQEEYDELTTLQRELDLDVAVNPKATRQRVLELQDSIDRNPVKGLIDAGMFQTILEDVDAENDDYSYKSRLTTKLEEMTEGAPKALKTGARWAYLAHDTPAYKLLFKGTQMSDFVARYALYQHLTTQKKAPMDHDSAIQRIADTFVNYDVPTHRTLQYLNDTGLVFFTKYYLRIQKVLLTLFQEKPARALALAGLESYMSSLPTVLDSGPRMANPLDAGALNFPGAIGEIAPIKLFLSLW